jgi:hypothetical protein
MSDYAYLRALRLGLIREGEYDKRDFLAAIHTYLGCSGHYAAEECDAITSKMSEEDFKNLIEAVKRKLKKQRALDSYLEQYITTAPAGVA